jgi:acetyl esterase/lipase
MDEALILSTLIESPPGLDEGRVRGRQPEMVSAVVDAEIAAALAERGRLAALTVEALPQLRQQIADRFAALPLSDRVSRREVTVAGRSGQPDVVLRIHVPVGLEKPAPCLYAMHAGGYVVGHRAMEDLRFDEWCPLLGIVGVSVEYRLAPETPFPGALDDCLTGLRWVHQHAAQLGVDPNRIGVSGCSAGGGLAAALAVLARDAGDLPLAWQLLAYPMLDDRMRTPSSQREVPVWRPSDSAFGWRAYLGPAYGSDSVPPLAAPARIDDLSGLPPALIFVGTADGFCDEDVEYATRLNHAGVPTELHVYPGAPHGFDRSAPNTELARRCVRDSTEWLAATLRSAAR